MKVMILLLLAAILISLGSGLFFLTKSKGEDNSTKVLRALKIRVGLSVALIVLLVVSFYVGWIPAPEFPAPVVDQAP